MLGDHLLTRPELTGRWEQRLNRIERGEERPRTSAARSTASPARWSPGSPTRSARTSASTASLAPCPTAGCEGQIVEYPKSYGCNTYHGKDDPGCGYTLWKQQNGAHHHARGGPRAHRRRPLEQGPRTEREAIGPCPTPDCGGEIVERTRSFGCTSWKSRSEPGCGYVIWKKVRGQKEEVDVETARRMVAAGETERRPPRPKEPLGACPTPGCGGQIVENSRALRLHELEEPQNPGCGFVIWKREKGHEVTREEAARPARGGAGRRPQVGAPTGRPPRRGGAHSPTGRPGDYSRSSGPGGQRRDHAETRAGLDRDRRRPRRACRGRRRAPGGPLGLERRPCG